MSKKDFVLLARWLKSHQPQYQNPDDNEYWYIMVRDLVDILKATNPNFDEHKFLGECGYIV